MREEYSYLESGEKQAAEVLSARLEEIHEKLGSNCDIFGWHLGKFENQATKPSLLAEIWQEINEGIYLKTPENN